MSASTKNSYSLYSGSEFDSEDWQRLDRTWAAFQLLVSLVADAWRLAAVAVVEVFALGLLDVLELTVGAFVSEVEVRLVGEEPVK